jgi:hypothetical protein
MAAESVLLIPLPGIVVFLAFLDQSRLARWRARRFNNEGRTGLLEWLEGLKRGIGAGMDGWCSRREPTRRTAGGEWG